MSFFSALKLIFSKKEKTGAPPRNIDKNKQKKKENPNKMSINEEVTSTANSKMESISGDSKQTTSSGKNHKFRDGRRYHGNDEVAYVLPNDDDGKILKHCYNCSYTYSAYFLFHRG